MINADQFDRNNSLSEKPVPPHLLIRRADGTHNGRPRLE